MADRTKDELIAEAESLGIDARGMNKAELEERLAAFTPEALGPVVPEGQLEPEPAKSAGQGQTTVFPQTESDIPDAGR